MHQLERTRRNNYSPLDLRSTFEWARGIKLPAAYAMKGEFDPDLNPCLLRGFEAMDDPTVREVVIRAAVRTGKTLIADLWLAHKFATDPNNSMFNIGDEKNARNHSIDRFIPLLNSIPGVKNKIGETPSSKTTNMIRFKDGTYCAIQALTNKNNFDARGVCWLVNDECHKSPPGHLDKAKSRTGDYRHKAKVLNISQGGIPKDDLDVLFEKGTQEYFGWTCPHCGLHQRYRWRNNRGVFNLRYEKNETTCPNGKWNYDALAKTLKYYCEGENCGYYVKDIPEERREMFKNSTFLPPANPTAPSYLVSCHFSQLPITWIPWREIVEDWIAANEAFDIGDSTKLKEFFQRRMGENWNESEARPYMQIERPSTGFMAGDTWDDEFNRFMTADVQEAGGRHFILVARAFSKNGKSRLIWAGKLNTYEEIEEKRVELGIRSPCVGLDCAHAPDEVLPMCAKYKWHALLGSDSLQFSHPGEKGSEFKPWSQPIKCVIGMGTRDQGKSPPAWKILWSNPYFKNMQFSRISGNKIEYLAPDNVDDLSAYIDNQSGKPTCYWEQMQSEARRPKKTKNGQDEIEFVRIGKRPNHMLDCERMILVLAGLSNCLGFDT